MTSADGSGAGLAAHLLADDVVVGQPVRLRASRCGACQRVEFPASVASCPACGGAAEALALGPGAVLHGATEVRFPPPDAKVAAPYTVVAAHFAAHDIVVLGILERYAEVAELPIGSRLEACVIAYDGGTTFGFRPVG